MQLTSILRQRYRARDDELEDSPDALEGKTRRWKSGAVVLVIGAGASLESGRRTWDNWRLRAELIKAVGPAFGGTGPFVREASHRLARHLPHVIGPGQNQRGRLVAHARTDHLCEVACRLARGRHLLIEFLRREYGPSADQVPPQLGYELIAHLVKHRFVDHLISLNFDETLDASLDDELGEYGYRKVLPGLSTSRAPLDLPHLFKVHGTISDADSLRFDTDDTGVLSAGMLRLLDRVVFGPVSPPRSVWVISLGYSWADPDLRAWLARNARWLAGVVCVALDRKPTDLLREELRRGQAAVESSTGPTAGSAGMQTLVEIYPVATEEVVADGDAATVDEVLWAVWNDVKRNTPHPDQDRVPSAARHLLISHLFRNRQGALRRWPAVYDRHTRAARFEAEVFLTTGKTDGLVVLSSLARDLRIIRHWSPDLGRRLPVIDRLGFLERNPYADVTEVYFLRGTAKEYARYFTRRKGERFPLSEQYVPDLWKERLDVPILRDGVIHRRRVRYIRFLHKYFRKVFFGPSVEVDPGLDPRAALLFRQPRSIPTYKALRDRTADLMGSNWTVLLVIAESGEWLTHFASTFTPPQQRTVLLIEASSFSLQAWTARRTVDLSQTNTPTIGIPWWVHNRHLTLAIGGDGSLLSGLYFRRRERTPRVSPIWLDDRLDLRELVKMFFSYAARFYEEWGSTTTPDDAARYAPAEFYTRLIEVSRGTALGTEGAMWTRRLERAWARYQAQVP